MRRERLVLFDIDGTILHGGALWRESFKEALDALFPGARFARISFAGKTDGQIFRELAASIGVSGPELERLLPRMLEEYLGRARSKLAAGDGPGEVEVLPGVREILAALSRQGNVYASLLTGNVREGARMKLECAGLVSHFDLGMDSGAFGDDHWDRYRLPALAVERAERKHGMRFSGKQVVVIGDTIHDVNCGKSIGVRSIAVGTGHQPDSAALREAGPDFFFADLSDTRQVLEAICGEVAEGGDR